MSKSQRQSLTLHTPRGPVYIVGVASSEDSYMRIDVPKGRYAIDDVERIASVILAEAIATRSVQKALERDTRRKARKR